MDKGMSRSELMLFIRSRLEEGHSLSDLAEALYRNGYTKAETKRILHDYEVNWHKGLFLNNPVLVFTAVLFLLVLFIGVPQVPVPDFVGGNSVAVVTFCVNSPPQLNISSCSSSLNLGDLYTCNIVVTDPNSDVTTANFTFFSNQSGVSFNATESGALLSFYSEVAGLFDIAVKVSDGSSCQNENDTEVLSVQVVEGCSANLPPSSDLVDSYAVSINAPWVLNISGTDQDGDQISYTVQELSYDSVEGLTPYMNLLGSSIVFNLLSAHIGSHLLEITLTDNSTCPNNAFRKNITLIVVQSTDTQIPPGGGGSGTIYRHEQRFTLDRDLLEWKLAPGEEDSSSVGLVNKGTVQLRVELELERSLLNWIQLPESFVIGPGEQHKIRLALHVPDGTPAGLYVGRLLVHAGDQTQIIRIIIQVRQREKEPGESVPGEVVPGAGYEAPFSLELNARLESPNILPGDEIAALIGVMPSAPAAALFEYALLSFDGTSIASSGEELYLNGPLVLKRSLPMPDGYACVDYLFVVRVVAIPSPQNPSSQEYRGNTSANASISESAYALFRVLCLHRAIPIEKPRAQVIYITNYIPLMIFTVLLLFLFFWKMRDRRQRKLEERMKSLEELEKDLRSRIQRKEMPAAPVVKDKGNKENTQGHG